MKTERETYYPQPLRASSAFIKIATPVLVGYLGLAACTTRELQDFTPEPTNTFVPTETQNPIPAATEVATETETAVPTQEIIDYGVCEIEDYRECFVSAEDLHNGNYLAFLETLSTPFNPNNFKKVVPFERNAIGRFIAPDNLSAPNFTGVNTFGFESETDFRRGVTSAYTEYEGRSYIVHPVEFFDPENPDKNVWVILTFPLYGYGNNKDFTEDEAAIFVDWWRNAMKVFPIYAGFDYLGNGVAVPLVERTFAEDPDIETKFDQFVEGKRSALHGKVLLTTVLRPVDKWGQ